MINKLLSFLSLMLLFIAVGCGSDDAEQEPEDTECGGEVTVLVDGDSEPFGVPLTATIVKLNQNSGTELLVGWSKNGVSLSVQVLLTDMDLACFPEGRIGLDDLPSNLSILGFQYTSIPKNIISSSDNVFMEDGAAGWVDIKSCDAENDRISLDFEFDAVTTTGEIIAIRGGSAVDVCFDRMK